MSANVGEELRPIHKIASGGELARIMLAMKNVLSEQDMVGTMVFDEVDTGVSGRAAQKVAEKMARISRRKQVLCVTHLPQLAAMADTIHTRRPLLFSPARGSLCRRRSVLLLPFITVTVSSCHYCSRFFSFVNTFFAI